MKDVHNIIKKPSLEVFYQTENSVDLKTSDETWNLLSPEYLTALALRERFGGMVWIDLFL